MSTGARRGSPRARGAVQDLQQRRPASFAAGRRPMSSGKRPEESAPTSTTCSMSSSTSTSGAASSSGPLAPCVLLLGLEQGGRRQRRRRASDAAGGGGPGPLRPPPGGEEGAGEGGPWFRRSAASSAARRRRARWTAARSASARRGRRGRRRRRRTTRSSLPHAPAAHLAPRAARRRQRERAASRAGRKNDSATSVGSVERKEVLGSPGGCRGRRAARSARRRAGGGARGVARAREVGDRKLVGALVRDGVEPSVAQCRSRSSGFDISVGTGSQPGSYPAPRRHGGAAARGLVRVRPLQLEHQPQLEQCVVNRLVEPVVEPRFVLCLHPQGAAAPASGRCAATTVRAAAYQGNRNESFRGTSRPLFRGPGLRRRRRRRGADRLVDAPQSQYAKRAEALRAEALQQKAEEARRRERGSGRARRIPTIRCSRWSGTC